MQYDRLKWVGNHPFLSKVYDELSGRTKVSWIPMKKIGGHVVHFYSPDIHAALNVSVNSDKPYGEIDNTLKVKYSLITFRIPVYNTAALYREIRFINKIQPRKSPEEDVVYKRRRYTKAEKYQLLLNHIKAGRYRKIKWFAKYYIKRVLKDNPEYANIALEYCNPNFKNTLKIQSCSLD